MIKKAAPVKHITSDTNPGQRAASKLIPKDFCDTYKNTANILKSNGINLNFGIVADIGQSPDSFIYSRSFRGNSESVANYVSDAVKCSNYIYTTIKHYPGHGRTSTDSHEKTPIINISYEEWEKTDFYLLHQELMPEQIS